MGRDREGQSAMRTLLQLGIQVRDGHRVPQPQGHRLYKQYVLMRKQELLASRIRALDLLRPPRFDRFLNVWGGSYDKFSCTTGASIQALVALVMEE